MAAKTTFEHRSFVGKDSIIPRPEVYFDADEGILVVATPWGARSPVERFLRTVVDYYLASRNDTEATSPFKRLTNLSLPANNLRVAVLLANEELYRDENRDTLRCGIELFAGILDGQELTWLQIGHPNCLLSRPNRPLILPMGFNLDLAAQMTRGSSDLPPLPSQLLGVDPHPNLWISSFRPQEKDQIILLSRSWIPEELLVLQAEHRNLSQISSVLAFEPNQPFWAGCWNL